MEAVEDSANGDVRLVPARAADRPAVPVAIWRQGGMTTITDTRTLTDRALAASADRVIHAARSCDRPHLVDDDVAVAWQGDRGLYTNIAYPLAPFSCAIIPDLE